VPENIQLSRENSFVDMRNMDLIPVASANAVEPGLLA